MISESMHELMSINDQLEEENAALRAEVERLNKKVEKQKGYLDNFDAVVDDFGIAVSCINPLEDLKMAIVHIKEQIAASQLETKRLREALEIALIGSCTCCTKAT